MLRAWGWHIPYKLTILGPDSLELRRHKADLIQVWKVLHRHDNIDEINLFERAHVNSQRVTRANASPYNLKINDSRLEQRRHFFSNRVINHWNALPEVLKGSQKLDIFKRRLNEHIV